MFALWLRRGNLVIGVSDVRGGAKQGLVRIPILLSSTCEVLYTRHEGHRTIKSVYYT